MIRNGKKSLLAISVLALAVTVGFAHADVRTRPAPDPYAGVDPEQQLERVTRDLETTEAELGRVRKQSGQVRSRMSARGRTWYRLVHAGLLPLGAGFDTLVAHTSKVERLRRALAEDGEEAAALNRAQAGLQQRRQKLIGRKAPLEMQLRAMAEASAALLETEDRKLAFDRAFASSAGVSDYTAVYGAAASPAGPLGPGAPTVATLDGFRGAKGRVPFPLAGRAEVRVVNRAGAGGQGLEMIAPAGSAVRAVFGGRVAFADEYSEYGRVVILDHGDSYFTLSGNLGAIDVRVGDEVGTGSRIGTVGAAGNKGLLYFELRHGADTLDPRPWMGL